MSSRELRESLRNHLHSSGLGDQLTASLRADLVKRIAGGKVGVKAAWKEEDTKTKEVTLFDKAVRSLILEYLEVNGFKHR